MPGCLSICYRKIFMCLWPSDCGETSNSANWTAQKFLFHGQLNSCSCIRHPFVQKGEGWENNNILIRDLAIHIWWQDHNWIPCVVEWCMKRFYVPKNFSNRDFWSGELSIPVFWKRLWNSLHPFSVLSVKCVCWFFFLEPFRKAGKWKDWSLQIFFFYIKYAMKPPLFFLLFVVKYLPFIVMLFYKFVIYSGARIIRTSLIRFRFFFMTQG